MTNTMANRTDPEALLHIDGMFDSAKRGFIEDQFSELVSGIASIGVEVGPGISTYERPSGLLVASKALEQSGWVASPTRKDNIVTTGSSLRARLKDADQLAAATVISRAKERVVGVITPTPRALGIKIFEQLLAIEEGVEPIVLGAVSAEGTLLELADIVSFARAHNLRRDFNKRFDEEQKISVEPVADSDLNGVAFSRIVDGVSIQFTIVELLDNSFKSGKNYGTALQFYAA